MLKIKSFVIRNLPIIILVLLSIWAGKGLYKYQFFSTHDGNHHLARIYDAIGTIAEGHFPLRWAGSLNYNCGVPIFNFFYPLTYYIAILMSHWVSDPLMILKHEFLATLIFGTLFFYWWIRQESKDKWLSVASAVLYLYAPYRFLNVFVRGDLAESLAYALIPLVLYFFAKAFDESNKKRIIVYSFMAAITGGLLVISHNFTVMFVMPIIFAYLIIKTIVLKNKNRFKIISIFFSFISTVGFGAFFVFPALLEIKFTKLTNPSFLYSEHFPAFWQLIHSKWDYFYSSPGTALDGMSFELGLAQWLVLILAVILIILSLIKLVKNRESAISFINNNLIAIFFFVISLIFIGLMVIQSDFVWKAFPLIQTIQFPWRLLGIAVLGLSALFPFLVMKIKNRFLYWLLITSVAGLAFVGNRNHLLPQPVIQSDVRLYQDFDKLHYERQSTTTFADDVLAPSASGACWYETLLITTDKELTPFNVVERGNTYGAVKFTVNPKPKGKDLVMGLGYFPGIYTFNLNGKNVGYNDCEGRVCLDLKETQEGPNVISWHVGQSPIQSFFNKVTLLFLGIWTLVLVLMLTGFRPKKWHLIIGLIFAVFIFFRFYNLEKRIAFGWDQERDANAIMQILAGDIKLIGPRVLSDTGFFLPPYFFYFLAPFYLLMKGSPYSMIPFLFSYNVAFFVSAFIFLKRIFSQKAALLFLAVWAVVPVAISADILSWNPLLVPLLFLMLLYLLHRADISAKRSLLFIIGLVWGLTVSMHVQALLFAPAFIPLIIRSRRKVLWILLGFVLTFSPIILFDINNKFLNLRLVFENLQSNQVKNIFAFLPVWDNFVARLFGTEVLRWFSIVFYIFVTILTFLNRRNTDLRRLLYIWISFPLFFVIYGARPSEYYFNYLLVIVILTFAYVITKIRNKFIYYGLILGALVILGYKAPEQIRDGVFGIYKKDAVVRFLKDMTEDSTPFNISFSIDPEGDTGFRYLLNWRGVKYTGDPKDPLVQISAPPKKGSTFIINAIGIELPDGWVKENWPR